MRSTILAGVLLTSVVGCSGIGHHNQRTAEVYGLNNKESTKGPNEIHVDLFLRGNSIPADVQAIHPEAAPPVDGNPSLKIWTRSVAELQDKINSKRINLRFVPIGDRSIKLEREIADLELKRNQLQMNALEFYINVVSSYVTGNLDTKNQRMMSKLLEVYKRDLEFWRKA